MTSRRARTSSARVLDIAPPPSEEESHERTANAAATAVLARQMADHRDQSTPMALLHLPSHADCPLCLRLAGLGKKAAPAEAAKPAAPLGTATNPLGSRNSRGHVSLPGRRVAEVVVEDDEAPVCTTVAAVEQVCAADTGVCAYYPRQVSLCTGGTPVILPRATGGK